jgi:hypothetical protein
LSCMSRSSCDSLSHSSKASMMQYFGPKVLGLPEIYNSGGTGLIQGAFNNKEYLL